MVDTKKIRDALLTPEFYNLELTSDLFTTILKADALDKLLTGCFSKGEKNYLPLRKKYSLEVIDEEQLSDPTTIQLDAADNLKRFASVIAQKSNTTVKSVEEKIKQMCITGVTYESISLELLPYFQPIIDCIQTLNNQTSNNIKVVTNILRNRVCDAELNLLFDDWKEEDTIDLGTNFINKVMVDFVFPERNGWEKSKKIEDEDIAGKSGNESKESKTENLELITTPSTKTLSTGESQTIDTVAS